MNINMMQAFEQLEPMLESETGGPVHLVRIAGQRWSYAAGRLPLEESFDAPQRVILSPEWALLFYPGNGSDIDREQIRELFEKHAAKGDC